MRTLSDLFEEVRGRGPIIGASTTRNGAAVIGRERRHRSAGKPGAKLIAAATALLLLLGMGLLAVSFAAQYRYVLAQRHQSAASVIEAGALDIGMVIFSLLCLGLARAGLAAKAERALIVACAAGSAVMNFAAADVGSARSVLAFVMPPLFLAVVADRCVVSLRRHVLGMRDGRSPWALLARAGLYGLRLVLDPWPTAKGFRRRVLEAAPLAAVTAPATVPALPAPAGEPEPEPRPGAWAALRSNPGEPDASAQPAAGRPARPRAAVSRVATPGKVTKTARFLALVEDTYGPLAAIPAGRVSPIAAELAPQVDLDPGAARTALGKARRAARNGRHS